MAQMIDALNHLVWLKTTDAHSKRPKHRPKPLPRPGMSVEQKQQQVEDKPMTVAEYARRTGMAIDFEGR
jgi:PHP family Zn ribbon phosphoesterase